MMPDNLPVRKSGKVLIPAVRPKDEVAFKKRCSVFHRTALLITGGRFLWQNTFLHQSQ
jgi:hypothetical protein